MSTLRVRSAGEDAARAAIPRVVLIRGCPRSGTSLVARLLNWSPSAAITFDYAIGSLVRTMLGLLSFAGEQQPLRSKIERGEANSEPRSNSYFNANVENTRSRAYPNEENFRSIVVGAFEAMFGKRGLALIGSKTPGNFAAADDLILEPWFENITHIFLIRNPQHTINSMLNRHNRARDGYDDWPWTNVEASIAEYRNNIRSVISHAYAYPESCLTLKYEDLMAEFDRTVQWLFALLKIDLGASRLGEDGTSLDFPPPHYTRDILDHAEHSAIESAFREPLATWSDRRLTGFAPETAPLVYDCLEPLGAARSYRYDYVCAEQERFALGIGWSVIQAEGVWSDRKFAHLLWTFEAGGPYTIVLEVSFFLPETAPTLSFAIELNGQAVLRALAVREGAAPLEIRTAPTRVFIGAGPHAVAIDAQTVSPGALQFLNLRIDDPRSPLEHGISTDDRTVAILLHSLSAHPISYPTANHQGGSALAQIEAPGGEVASGP